MVHIGCIAARTEETDVLVVGAGPAGIAAAAHLHRGGAQVVLIDNAFEIGKPLRCAELTRSTFFEEVGLEPRAGWQRWTLDDGNILLDRAKVEGEGAAVLAEVGVDVRAACAATAVGEYDGEARVVEIRHGDGAPGRIRARLVVAADGVSSFVARLAGIPTKLKPGDAASTLAYRLEDVALVDSRRFVWERPEEILPHYFWVIPLGERAASVGVGMPPRRARALGSTLRRLMDESPHFHGGRVVEEVVGWYPSTRPLEDPVRDGLVVAGTAARLIGADSGDGIWQAAVSGRIAARTFLESGGRSTIDALSAYRPALQPIYEECYEGYARRLAREQGRHHAP